MWLLFLEARQLSLTSLTCHQRFPFLFQQLSVHMINYASIVAQYRVIKCIFTSWFFCDWLKKATNCKTKSISETLYNHILILDVSLKRVWRIKYHFFSELPHLSPKWPKWWQNETLSRDFVQNRTFPHNFSNLDRRSSSK